METKAPHPLLVRAVPAAMQLIREDHFSLENLCHALDSSLRELAEAVGSVDELVLHVNDRFLSQYIEMAEAVDKQAGSDPMKALSQLSLAWLEYAQAHPQQLKVLLQHRWSAGFERPEWYMQRVRGCFVLIEKRLKEVAPKAPPELVAAAARAIYAEISGLCFLSMNERATPVGIASQQQLLMASVGLLAKGLQQS